jgi:tRNA pseudouridine38-40 synthase
MCPKLPLRTFRFEIAYDGTEFHGWARQPDRRTVQGLLEATLRTELPEMRRIAVGGRTDRGVHATGQVFSFTARTHASPEHLAALVDEAAPEELLVLRAGLAPRWFHAQYSAVARRYVYLHPVLATPGAARLAARIDRMLQELVGRRDFHAFARDTPKNKSTVRHLRRASARMEGRAIRFDLEATAFLRRQVRVMVATALREARAGSSTDALLRLADAGARAKTAPPAPPGRLWLTRIHYGPTPRG